MLGVVASVYTGPEKHIDGSRRISLSFVDGEERLKCTLVLLLLVEIDFAVFLRIRYQSVWRQTTNQSVICSTQFSKLINVNEWVFLKLERKNLQLFEM